VIPQPALRLLLATLCLLSIALAGGARLGAIETGTQNPSVEAGSGSESSGQPSDGWNFEDEEEAGSTLAEVLSPQAVDLVAFPVFMTLALVSFFKKSAPLKTATFVAAILYLGVMRSQLYSVVNIFAMLSGNLPVVQHNIFWYLFATFTLGSTVLWGRVYCGRVCAFGALTQLMDRVVPARWRYEPSLATETRLAWIKYALLVGVVVYYLTTRDIGVYRYVEPFWMFSGRGSAVMWGMLAALLAATVFVRNLYCRFLCPVGAFLGVISTATTILPIKRWSECKSCKICEKACEWGAIQGPRIVKSECVRCDDCERIYADQQKCVHWLVIRRKSTADRQDRAFGTGDLTARPSAPPPASAGL
jgi:polyferredoxin